MIHDRLSYGGALVAVGLLYWWLTESPLRRRQAWAWRLLLGSGIVGFASFFAYLGYGYLDTWHGVATLALLPCFALGLARSAPTMAPDEPTRRWSRESRDGVGRLFLLSPPQG